jgi:tRNA pseudouridine synthase 10
MTNDSNITHRPESDKDFDEYKMSFDSNRVDKIFQIAVEIIREGYVCNRCLGRAFGKLLHGLSNEQRGKIVRDALALMIETGYKPDLDTSNFQSYKFRKSNFITTQNTTCMYCNNIFNELIPALISEALAKSKNYEYSNFLVGTKLDEELFDKDILLNRISPEYSESIKDEINRIIGKEIEEICKRTVEHQDPELLFLINLQKNEVEIKSKNMYIYSGYMKLVRGIPQTTWHCKSCRGKGCKKCKWTGKLFRTSVQQIIEKPVLQQFKSSSTNFHGAGREDVDVRCLDYRPFIIEIINPKKRTIDLQDLKERINRSNAIQVNELKFASKNDIAYVKNAKNEKVYHAIVTFKKKVDDHDLLRLASLGGVTIKQKTPLRVVHRRADIIRERRIKNIEFRKIGVKVIDLLIECDAGTYVKEFINSDNSRTTPSVANVLNNIVKKIVLDVIRIIKSEN